MNNSAEIISNKDDQYRYFENISILLINSLSLTFNVLCIFTFIKNDLHKKSRYDLFKYFLFVSISNSAMSINNIFSLVVLTFISDISLKSSLSKVYIYNVGVLTMNAAFLEVSASLIRYFTIDERFRRVRERLVNYKIIAICLFLFSMAISIYRIFLIDLIDARTIQQVTDIFQIQFNDSYPNEVALKWFAFSYSFIRDILCSLVLVTINICLVMQFRKDMEKKRFAQGAKSSKLVISTEKSQQMVTRMVMCIALKSTLCHMPYFLIYQSFSNIFTKNELFLIVALDALEISYFFNFFLYLSFNKRFKENFILICNNFFRARLNKICYK